MILSKEQSRGKYMGLTLEAERPLFCPFTGVLILSPGDDDLSLRGACFMIYVAGSGMERLHKKYRARWEYFLTDPDEDLWGRELETFMESFEEDPNVVFIEVRDGGAVIWMGLDGGMG